MSWRDRRLIEIALLLASLILSFAILEFVLRIQYRREHQRLAGKDPNREFCTTAADDPVLIYRYVPNRPGCETNSQGYRDHEHAFKKQAGVFRIVIIGDSVAEGWGVPREQAFARVAEKEASRLLSRRVEAIILARQGYSTSQELVLLRSEAFRYDPDLIVWSYVLNDPADPVFHNENSEAGRFFFRPKVFLFHFVRQELFWFHERIARISCGSEYHELLHCAYWNNIGDYFREIGALARAHSVPVLFLLSPVFEGSSFDRYTLKGLHQRLIELAAHDGLQPLDGLDCYRDHTPDELRLHREVFDPWHPNPKAHAILGKCLAAAISSGQFSELQGGT